VISCKAPGFKVCFFKCNLYRYSTDLEAVERIWVLRAIDERWQRHLVEMQVLRNSVNVR
jgi:preprotein translocase subunit SecA